eukprot:11786066-Karenia_brevis.AAC.1
MPFFPFRLEKAGQSEDQQSLISRQFQNQDIRPTHHRFIRREPLTSPEYPRNATRTTQRTTPRPPVHNKTKRNPRPPEPSLRMQSIVLRDNSSQPDQAAKYFSYYNMAISGFALCNTNILTPVFS